MAYGGKLWVAVGDDSGSSLRNVLWSSDGIKWNESTGSSFLGIGHTVAYGMSSDNKPLWVAGGQGDSGTSHGNIMTSRDGKDWVLSSADGPSLDPNVYSIAYGHSSASDPLWVALGDSTDSKSLMWSDNGHDWNYSGGIQVSLTNLGGAVAYGTSNGTDPLWLAGSDTLVQSSDGKSWSAVTDNIPAMDINTIVYGTTNGTDNIWVAGGHVTNGTNEHYAIQWSTTGTCWIISTGEGFNLTDGKIRSISYKKLSKNKVLWIATGNSGGLVNDDQLLYSTDGKNWLSYNKVLFGIPDGEGTEGGYGIASNQEKYPL